VIKYVYKITKVKRAGEVAQVGEHLPSKHKALISNTSTKKKKKKRTTAPIHT
jgi:hypothetical protein